MGSRCVGMMFSFTASSWRRCEGDRGQSLVLPAARAQGGTLQGFLAGRISLG